MKQCWRWFGPQDPIALSDLHQVGVQGIVTALHQFDPGTLWPVDAIRTRQETLQTAGFSWDVVESLPVSEAIKTQGPDMHSHLVAYKASLQNLASEGIKTVCYNFMPILDWTRTRLREKQQHGGMAMYFSLLEFAVFDLHILQRNGAQEDYSEGQRQAAADLFEKLTSDEQARLRNNIIAGLPGANDRWTLDDVKQRLATYDGINAEILQRNLIDFLSEVAPAAEDLGIRLCCHPDDPPFSLLGLPRVMSSLNDYQRVLGAVDLQASGATLCTGSLGVDDSFDPVEFIKTLGDRIHFAHLRNTTRIANGDPLRPDFFESAHLEGNTDMIATIRALIEEEHKRRTSGQEHWQIPMRPDHGQELLSDVTMETLPGYPLIGRMRGLAELRGVMAALEG